MKCKLEEVDNSNLIVVIRNIQKFLGKGYVLTKLEITKDSEGYNNNYGFSKRAKQ